MGCFRLIDLSNLARLWHGHIEDIFLHIHIASRVANSHDNKDGCSATWHSRGWTLCLERHLYCRRCTTPGPAASLHGYHTLTGELERGQSRDRCERLIALNLHDNRIR